jgi:BirA family biotin operon repressor/biotin-[acetyl-CoA-carboxylase] ligase
MDIYKTIDSTNTFAKNLALLGGADGQTVIADSQHAGRGRQDHSFFSPAGNSIYMSVIIRPKLVAEQSLLITSAAAVAVTDALLEVAGLETRIKWVNDILTRDKKDPRKLCGILTEAALSLETAGLDYAVIGIGVNINNTTFPTELKNVVTSVFLETKEYNSRNHIAAAILNHLEKRLDSIENGGFMEDYRARSVVIGKNVKVTNGNSVYKAKVEGIDDYGRLILTDSYGQTSTLSAGSITIL